MANGNHDKKVDKKKVGLGVGLGLAAAAASAAGYYFYASKDASKNRKKAAKWANDFKGDVMAKAKKLKKFDEKAYRTLVDETMRAYKSVKSIDGQDLAAAALELKSNWKNVQAELARLGIKGDHKNGKKNGTAKKAAAKKSTAGRGNGAAKSPAKKSAKKAPAKKK